MTAAEYDRVPQVVGADYELPVARSLERIWATKPGLLGWISTVDHKEIGIRYIVTAFVFLIAGGLEALTLRVQLARPNQALLTPEQYDELFSMHGITMIFLYASPVLSGFSNYLFPLVLGARDMAFPRLNAFSYWVYLAAGLFIYSSLLVAAAPNDGWFNYVPYALREYNPGPEHRFLCAGDDLPRDFDDGRLGKFRGDLSAHAGARHVAEPRSHSHLGNDDRLCRQPSRGPFGQPGVLSFVDRPPVRNALLSAEQRRPSAALAASLLDVRASLGLRRRAAGDGAGFRLPALLLPQAARRLFRGGDWNGDDHGARLWRLAAPHVRNRHSISRARFFQRRVLRHRHSKRDCRVRVGRDDLDRPSGADHGLSLLTPASS